MNRTRHTDPDNLDRFRHKHGDTVERLWNSISPGERRWRCSINSFTRALQRSLASRFNDQEPSIAEAARYFESLQLDDLTLACACSEGQEAAWEEFVTRYRNSLENSAVAIAGSSAGTNLADSLYAELYGVRGKSSADEPQTRRPLFDYFHGRSKLSTWLRAILAQRHVDAIRASRNTESLDSQDDDTGASLLDSLAAPASSDSLDPDRARLVTLLQQTLVAALAALDARDRARLSYYYAQDLTLAQIGRLLGEHEATVSRKLDRVRTALRNQVEGMLHTQHHLSNEQILRCFEYARGNWQFDLTSALNPGVDGEQTSSPESLETTRRSTNLPAAPAPRTASFRWKQE